jgi:UDP-N-acetylmuramate dehydrogenase
MEIGNRIIRVEGYNLETLQYQTFLHSQCNFAYRNSVFKSELKNTFLITAVVFALQRFDESYQCMIDYADLKSQLENQHPLTLHKVSQLIAEVRASKLPDHTKIGTAGSFFANPIVDPQHLESLKTEYPEMPHRGTKLSAGRLIEKAGLK